MGLSISRRAGELPHRVSGALHDTADQVKTRFSTAWRSALCTVFPGRFEECARKADGCLKVPDSHIPAFNEDARNGPANEINPDAMSPVLVTAGSLGAGRPIVNYFTTLGFEVQFTLALEEAIQAAKAAPEAWSLVAIEIDSLGGIYEVADDLLGCRAAVSDVPVILLSEDFSVNDLSQERLPICDASLQRSSNSAMLMKGVKAAIENNLAWRGRARQLHAHG
ncbi:hypothetical protein [Leisingera sp.]|uniref:hypothetical protein n=1 Tax=Leisingera sp. TaxID=1879318 RepID=UPI002B27081B|nr:hypothetical protein [Leisingera sp.]